MASRNPCRLGLLLLLILAFAHLLEGYDLSKRREPKGKLQVRLDISLARQEWRGKTPEGRLRWQWSSYLQFWDDVNEVSNKTLRAMAIDAYKEMEADTLQYKLLPDAEDKNRAQRTPGVMTILAWKHGIILASSQKGKSGFVTSDNNAMKDTEVVRILNLCETIFKEETTTDARPDGISTDHINQRKCGEVYAYVLYHMIDKVNGLKDMMPRARITSVSREKLEDGSWGDGYVIVPACPGKNPRNLATTWGCNLMNKQFNTIYLEQEMIDKEEKEKSEEDKEKEKKNEGDPYDLKKIAGGLAQIGQQQLCGKYIEGKMKL